MSWPLYSQPRRWHSRQEAPDQVVVLVAEGEVRAAHLGHPQAPDEHLDRVAHRAVRSLDRGRPRRIRGEQVAQAAELVRVVPVHPHPEPDRLLGLARGEGQDPLLAEADELGDAEGLDVLLAGEAEVAFDVDLDPQALAVEPVLVALVVAEHRVEALVEVLVGPAPGVVDAHRVVGRDRAVEEAPARAARVLGPQPGERPSLAPSGEHLVLGRDEVGLGADGTKHLASAGRLEPRPRQRRWGIAPAADKWRSEYPTRDAAPGRNAPAPAVGLRGGLPVPDLPRPRPRLCRRLDPGDRLCRGAPPAARPERRDVPQARRARHWAS